MAKGSLGVHESRHTDTHSRLQSQPAGEDLGSRARLMVSPVLSSYLLLEMPKGALEKLQRVQSGGPPGRSLSGPAVSSQPREKRGQDEVAMAGARARCLCSGSWQSPSHGFQ